MIQLSNDGDKITMTFALDQGRKLDVQMDPAAAMKLAEGLVVNAVQIEQSGVKSAPVAVEERPEKKGFERFMDEVNQVVNNATAGVKKD